MKFSSLSSIYQVPIGMIHTTLRVQDLILVLKIWFSGFGADKCAHFFFDNFFAETRILQFSSATQNDSKLHRVPNENQGENNRETTNPNTGLFHVIHIFFGRFSSVTNISRVNISLLILAFWSSPWYIWHTLISRFFWNWSSLRYKTHLSLRFDVFLNSNLWCTNLNRIQAFAFYLTLKIEISKNSWNQCLHGSILR